MGKEPRDAKLQEMSLFSDIRLAKAIPDRALSKGEVDLVVAIRSAIQEQLKSALNLKTPIKFRLHFADLAEKKGAVKRSFKQSMEAVADNLSKHIPAETIDYVSANGDKKTLILPMLQSADVNKTQGYIDIEVGQKYQKYYAENVLAHPELQLEQKFYLACTSKYSYPLANWLTSQIAEQRDAGKIGEDYDIIVKYEDLRKRVPPASNLTTTGYKTRVIWQAIDDINTNEFSQLRIMNRDNIIYSKKGKSIYEYIFKVKIFPTEEKPIFTPHPDPRLIDKSNVPSWSYITKRLENFHFSKSQWPKWEPFPEQTWKAYLYTIARHKPPQYMSKLFDANLSRYTIRNLACKGACSAPEHIDDVIATIICDGYGPIENPLNQSQKYKTDPLFIHDLILKNPALAKYVQDKVQDDEEPAE